MLSPSRALGRLSAARRCAPASSSIQHTRAPSLDNPPSCPQVLLAVWQVLGAVSILQLEAMLQAVILRMADGEMTRAGARPRAPPRAAPTRSRGAAAALRRPGAPVCGAAALQPPPSPLPGGPFPLLPASTNDAPTHTPPPTRDPCQPIDPQPQKMLPLESIFP